MSYKTRDEDLFWKVIEAYFEIAPDGPLTSGIMYTASYLSQISLLLSTSVIVTTKGFKADIYVIYDSPEDDRKYRELVKDGFVCAEKTWAWEEFRFDDWLKWLTNNGTWDNAIETYAKTVRK